MRWKHDLANWDEKGLNSEKDKKEGIVHASVTCISGACFILKTLWDTWGKNTMLLIYKFNKHNETAQKDNITTV